MEINHKTSIFSLVLGLVLVTTNATANPTANNSPSTNSGVVTQSSVTANNGLTPSTTHAQTSFTDADKNRLANQNYLRSNNGSVNDKIQKIDGFITNPETVRTLPTAVLTNSVAGLNCNSPSITDLDFVGLHFTGNVNCVRAQDDASATVACGAMMPINPGNPQYTDNSYGGERDRNGSLNHYFCVERRLENSKRFMCEVMAPIANNGMEFQWIEQTQYDGNCVCKLNDANSMRNCNRGTQEALAAAPAAAAAAPTADPAAALQQQISEFNQCIEEWRNKANTCKTDTETAVQACRPKEEDNNVTSTIGDLLGGGATAVNGMRAGTGNQQTCFKTSIMASAAREGIRQTQETCDAEFGSCRLSCREEVAAEYMRKCPEKLNLTAQSIETAGQTNPALQSSVDSFNTAKSETDTIFQDNRTICNRDIRNRQNTLSGMLDELGNALAGSLRCACQLANGASGNGADCNNIPNINTCEQTNAPGCDIYGNLNSCTPGSPSYDARTCNCLQNPSACSGTNIAGGSGGPSLFGGNLRTVTGSGGAGSFAGSGAGGSGSNFDLSGGGGETNSSGMALNAATAGSGSGGAAGGSSGGGSASSGGGAGNGDINNPNAEGGEKSGLAGIWGQVKSSFGNAFGSRNKPSNVKGGKGNGDSKGVDTNRFKPRGLAGKGGNGLGTPNMDIFAMVKRCAIGETCISNQKKENWIIDP